MVGKRGIAFSIVFLQSIGGNYQFHRLILSISQRLQSDIPAFIAALMACAEGGGTNLGLTAAQKMGLSLSLHICSNIDAIPLAFQFHCIPVFFSVSRHPAGNTRLLA